MYDPSLVSSLSRRAGLLIGLAAFVGCAGPRQISAIDNSAMVRTAGTFKVALFVTNDLELLKERWAQPTPPTFPAIYSAELGDELHAVIVFAGCAADSSGYCRVVSRFAITAPDGAVHPFDIEYTVFAGKAPPPGQLRISDYAHTFGITNGPRGEYTVSATVDDQVSETRLNVAAPLVLQ